MMGVVKAISDWFVRRGKIERISDEEWNINLATNLSITLFPIDQQTALQFYDILTEPSQKHRYEQVKATRELISEKQIRCNQIEEYVATYKPIFQTNLEEAKRKSAKLKKLEQAKSKAVKLEMEDDIEEQDELIEELITEELIPKAFQSLDLKMTDWDYEALLTEPPTSFEYHKRMAQILWDTTLSSKEYNEFCEEFSDYTVNEDKDIAGFEVELGGNCDTCKSCLKASKKKYPKKSRPILPFHLGCTCEVQIRDRNRSA